MPKDYLYIEQRISITRRALNEKSVRFEQALTAAQDRRDFHQFVIDLMNVLDGFTESGSVERLERD